MTGLVEREHEVLETWEDRGRKPNVGLVGIGGVADFVTFLYKVGGGLTAQNG